jgi:NodT family efflux transporter outer membrane factor (OMF) lipoprotein
VSLAETQLETVRSQLTDLGVQRAQFEHAIAVLAGKPPAQLSISVTTRQAPPPVVSVGVPSLLLERRPDVAAAERQVAAANEQIGIAKSAFFPSLTLSGSGASELTALLSAPTTFWSLGPQVLAAIFDGGKRQAQVKQTEAAYDETVAQYRQTVLTAFQQVEDGLSALRILEDEATSTDRAVKAAQQSLDISTDQYRNGMTSYLQVISSQTATLQNQRAVTNVLTRRMLASVSLIQALGGGWDVSQI